MTPAWIMSLLLAGVFAAVFKVMMTSKARGLAQCWLVALVGFLAGQVLTENIAGNSIGDLPIASPQLGDIHLLPATLCAWLLMFIVARARLW